MLTLVCAAGCKQNNDSQASKYSIPIHVSETLDFDPASHTWPHATSDIPPDMRVKFGQLGNGMRYAILPAPDGNDVVSIQMSIAAGFEDEPDGKYGVAHLLEHMTFRGARSADDQTIVHDMQNAGVLYGLDLNGYTHYDETYYQLNLQNPSNKTVYQALQNFQKLLSEPNLTEHSLAIEKKVVIAELMQRLTPQARAKESQTHFEFPDQKRRKVPLIGTEESINALTLEDVIDFFGAQYLPSNTLIVIAGDVKADRTVKVLTTLFGDWHAPPRALPLDMSRNTAKELSNFPMFGQFHEKGMPTKLVAIENKPSTHANDILENRRKRLVAKIVNSAFSARLKPYLEDDKDVSWINVDTYQSHRYDVRSLEMGARNMAYERAMSLFEKERLRAIKYGFLEPEIDRALKKERARLERRGRFGQLINARTEANALRLRFRRGEVYTSPQQELSIFEAFATELSLKDYNLEMQSLWSNFEPRIWMQAPSDPKATMSKARSVIGSIQLEDILPARAPVLLDFTMPALGPVGHVTKRKTLRAYNLNQLEWNNGTQLNYVRNERGEEAVAVTIAIGGDLSVYRDYYSSLSHWVSAFSSADIKGIAESEIANIFAGQDVGFSVMLDGETVLLTMTTNNKDLPAALKVATAFIMNPDVKSDTQASRFKQNLVNQRNGRKSSPLSAGNQQILYRWSNKDNAFNSRKTGRVDMTSTLRGFFQEILKEGSIEVGVSGNFDPEVLEAAFSQTLGALPSRQAIKPASKFKAIDISVLEAGEITLFHGGSDAQMALFYCWPLDYTKSRVDKYSVYNEIMAMIIMNRVTERIRQELGVTYSPSNFSYFSPAFNGMQLTCLTIQFQPEDEGLIKQNIDVTLEQLLKTPITEEEFNRTKRPIITLVKRAEKIDRAHTFFLSRARSDPETYIQYRNVIETFEAVSFRNMRSFMAERLSLEELRIFRVQHYEQVTALNRRKTKLKAQKGDAEAQYAVGVSYTPSWTDEDRLAAKLWFGKAADQGHELANLAMGRIAWENKEFEIAIPYLERSKAQPESDFILAEIYYNNRGLFPHVSQERILSLYRQSAESNYVEAQRALAYIYNEGSVLPRDDIQALTWMFIATNSYDSADINFSMKYFAEDLEDDQIETARERARAWVVSNESKN